MDGKLIIGFDPALGEDSLALGAGLAETLAARAIVVTAFHVSPRLRETEDLQRVLEAESRAGFALARERLSGLEVETRASADRSVAEDLHRVAEQEGARLIVVGSSHRGALRRLGLGNVVDSVLRGAPCAVAVAPRGYADRERRALRRLAVAFDGSADSWAALETGIGIAERTDGELTLLTVAEPPQYGYASAWSVLSTGEIRDFEREAKERVLELARERIPEELPVDTRLSTGYPGRLLAEASGEFDLLIAGSRGYGPLRRTLLGSSTRELLRNGGCPVIILPRALSIDPLGARPREAVAKAAADPAS